MRPAVGKCDSAWYDKSLGRCGFPSSPGWGRDSEVYKLKLILRYLLRRRIALLPVLAVAVAVFLLVVVLAVMRGFAGFIEDKLRGTMADVIVESNDVRGFDGWEPVAERLRRISGVEAVSPHLSGKGVLTVYGGLYGRPFDYPCLFAGIDLEAENSVTRFGRYLIDGKGFADPWRANLRTPGIILGSEIFGPDTANIHIGYPVTLTTPTAFDEMGSKDFLVTAKFKTGLYEHDRTTVYVPLAAAQKLLDLEGRVTSLHLRVKPGEDLEKIKSAARAALEGRKGLIVQTWMESQKVLIDAMALERIIWIVVLSALLAVAGFCILAVMSLTVIQKTRDIGILRAVGASARGVLAAFLEYGLAVGIIGATLGLVGALLVLYHIDTVEAVTLRLTGWTPWPRDVFYFERIPVEMNGWAFLSFWTWGIAVAFAASLYPAARAARTDPVRTLRIEH